jgi:amino acid transporter
MQIIELNSAPENDARNKTPLAWLRWFIFGTPIASQHSEEALLPKLIALPIFCSDAISSVAYGGQQILLALCMAGLWLPENKALYAQHVMGISWLIALLLIIVTASYWQTLFAYPNGGGSYIVSKDNLGEIPGLIAAAALLIDYVLTAAVSVTSGMQNLKDVPLFSALHIGDHLVIYCVLVIWLCVFANLRGLKESGKIFALPTYVFIFMCFVMVLLGLFGAPLGWRFHPEYVNQTVPKEVPQQVFALCGVTVLLRAFANGCSAMTGVEATSNGIPSFQVPKSRNAAITLLWMAVILGTIFISVSWLAVTFHVVYWEHNGSSSPAVIDQLSGMIFGKEGPWSWAYVVTQVFTALILIVAAQTSFAGFPRLASILARDSFLPRQLANVGDKLAFNNGIMVLGLFSTFLVIMEKGSVDRLIPYFAIGVFMAFTMSQTGMVRHWFQLKDKGWHLKAVVNGLGALASFIVVIDILLEKFFDGAWAVILVGCGLLFLFLRVRAHYDEIRLLLNPVNYPVHRRPLKNTVLVLVQGVHAGTLSALDYARSISSNCKAVFIATDSEQTEMIKSQWQEYAPDIALVVIASPYRSLLAPIMLYLDQVHAESPDGRITVIIGEFVPKTWWENMLHGNTGLLLKLALLGRKDVVVANVRYWLDRQEQPCSAAELRRREVS